MTVYDRIAVTLAAQFPQINPATLARARAFCLAVDRALGWVPEGELVAHVVDGGPLTGARKPYGALIARVQHLPGEIEHHESLVNDLDEAAHWRQLDKAAQLGLTLRDLVTRSELFEDEARERIADEFDDPRLQDVAMAALLGRRR